MPASYVHVARATMEPIPGTLKLARGISDDLAKDLSRRNFIKFPLYYTNPSSAKRFRILCFALFCMIALQ